MAFTIPTAKQLATTFLSALEARIAQTTPPVARAFNRVLSVALAMFGVGVYKYVADRALQALALTATSDGLDTIGTNYGVTRRPAVSAVLEFTLVAVNGTIIPAGTIFSSVSTGEEYTTTAEVTAALGEANLQGSASTPGGSGNLAIGEALAIGTPIAGANAIAYVAATLEVDAIVTAGEDRELDTDYRRRVLTRIRAAGGGGNSADYRAWGEDVADVARVFPYSGKPITALATEDFSIDGTDPFIITYEGVDPFSFTDLNFHDLGFVTISGCGLHAENNITTQILSAMVTTLTVVGPLTTTATEEMTLVNESLPGDRTVYVESEADPDDCPPATLTAVRDALLTDPETGLARMPLGLIDERLYVESTYRTDAQIWVIGLDVPADVLAEVQAKIEVALEDYVARVCCFVGGLDYPGDRVDTVSKGSFATVVQGVVRGYGGSIEYVTFEIGAVEQNAYQLSQGELLGLVDVNPVIFDTVYP
jgi:hypothetical protein